jgi:hypothetical protein
LLDPQCDFEFVDACISTGLAVLIAAITEHPESMVDYDTNEIPLA